MKSCRARLLPATAALIALGLSTACGGGSDSLEEPERSKPPAAGGSSDADGKDGTDGSGDPKPGSTRDWPEKPAKGKLSDDELGEYALAQGDVPGFKVRIPSESELEGMGEEKAKDAKCQPLGGLMAAAPQPSPSASVYRTVMAEPDEKNPSGLVLFETLAAYDSASADRLFSGVRKALGDCADGFETTAKGEEGIGEYTAAKELAKPKLKGADDVLAFQLDADAGEQRLPILFNVIRTDSTVAIFYAMNLMQPEKAVIPEAVAEAQTDKLT